MAIADIQTSCYTKKLYEEEVIDLILESILSKCTITASVPSAMANADLTLEINRVLDYCKSNEKQQLLKIIEMMLHKMHSHAGSSSEFDSGSSYTSRFSYTSDENCIIHSFSLVLQKLAEDLPYIKAVPISHKLLSSLKKKFESFSTNEEMLEFQKIMFEQGLKDQPDTSFMFFDSSNKQTYKFNLTCQLRLEFSFQDVTDAFKEVANAMSSQGKKGTINYRIRGFMRALSYRSVFMDEFNKIKEMNNEEEKLALKTSAILAEPVGYIRYPSDRQPPKTSVKAIYFIDYIDKQACGVDSDLSNFLESYAQRKRR